MSDTSTTIEFEIPDVIPIGSQFYRVKLADLPEVGDSETCVFHSRPDGKTLWMVPEFCDMRAMLLALFHGCIHGIEEEYGLTLSEKNVDRLAQGWVQVTLALVEAQE